MNIAKLQEEFANNLYDKNNKIFSIINKDGIKVKERLDIYKNNVFGNFDTALELTYEITKKIVGDDYFKQLNGKYHQKYPSNSGNLDDYGLHFPKFLKAEEKEHKLLYLADVAKLEWLYHISYLAKDSKGIDIEKLQKVKEEDFFKIKFKMHPSCHLMQSQYPIYKIWKTNQKDSDEIIDIKLKDEYILVQRAIHKVTIHKLTKNEFIFLQNIKKGNNIFDIYEIMSKGKPNFDIGKLINKYISNLILTKFRIE